ncbi:hypothetical protein TL16_g00106 [Triparma laevis f. inornata]|uniref:Uncharacterized protein n=1 Tax=Triparma laevis f. inornata TaxID=1714386 RepID=A0A9W6ZA69_9STRA|nr:hypothetical protein TL16_g00106 [Triparma laevis f. inornata]
MAKLLSTLASFYVCAQASAACDHYSVQLINPDPAMAQALWWHGHNYPTFHVGPCTILNFGSIQDNQNVIKTTSHGYEVCGGDEYNALEASSTAEVGSYTVGDVVYKVEDVAEDDNLYFIDTKANLAHCFDGAKVHILVVAEAKPWNLQFGSTEEDRIRGVAWDKVTGHVVMVGETMGGLDPDKNDGETMGDKDSWAAVVDGLSGELRWTVQEGTNTYERFVAVAVDSSDASIWIMGETEKGLFYDPTSSSASSDFLDVFLARYTSTGVLKEHVLIGGSGQDFAVDLKIAEDGDVIVLVAHSDSDHRYLGDGSTYGGDMVMRVYRLDGDNLRTETLEGSLKNGGCDQSKGCKWMREFYTDEGASHTHQDSDSGMGDGKPWRDVTPSGVALGLKDGQELAYVTGVTSGSSADLGGNSGGASVFDGFLVQMNAEDGAVTSSSRISSGSARDKIAGICMSAGGDPIVVGFTKGTMQAGHANSGGFDMFARMYSKVSMEEIWTVQKGGPEDDYGYSCAGDGGGVYVAGRSRGGLEGMGGWDVRLMKVESNSGAVEWDRQFGTPEDDQIGDGSVTGGVVIDEVGGAIVAGVTRGAMSYCGYLWGVKKTETKYGRLQDDPNDSKLQGAGGGRAVMMKQDDENYDL